MTDELAAAASAAARARRAAGQLDRARADLHAAILAAQRAGVRQAELARATGYSRERLRQLERAAARRLTGEPRC